MSTTSIQLPGRTINGIHTTEMFIRLTREVVIKGWIRGENREAIFAKAQSMRSALGVESSGCFCMNEEDTNAPFEVQHHCKDAKAAEDFMEFAQRVLL